jgi:hypothetical protein
MASTSLHLPALSLGSRTALPRRWRERGVIASLFDALTAPRRSDIDRELADLIERSGGKFTDSLERAIEQRLFHRP